MSIVHNQVMLAGLVTGLGGAAGNHNWALFRLNKLRDLERPGEKFLSNNQHCEGNW
jgi:hypothetical protein